MIKKITTLTSEIATRHTLESHAVAYATLAYQCAYLKTYYPEEFESSFAESGK